jgi:RimJ/RimL family protein N-acetyltransferase
MPRRATAVPSHRPVRLAPARPVEVAVPEPIAPVSLRPLQDSDRPEFLRGIRLSRESLDRWLPLHRPGETDDALFDRQLQLTLAGDAAFSACRRIAISPRPGRPDRILGAFNIIAITRGLELSGDLNWWLAADARGQGIARRALRLLVSSALALPPEGLGLHLLRAYIQRDNFPSIHLAESLGFSRREDGRSHIQTGARWVVHDLYTLSAA